MREFLNTAGAFLFFAAVMLTPFWGVGVMAGIAWIFRRLIVFLPLLSLMACSEPEGYANMAFPRYDHWGNRYPDECMRDLSDVHVPIRLVPRQVLDNIKAPEHGRGLLGWYQRPLPYNPTGPLPAEILIWDRLKGSDLEEAIRHEKCHAIAGAWHK